MSESISNILLVEDEPLIQKSLKRLLEREGASVDVESLGKSAIKLIHSNSYDRIICDLMLQDITGFDVIEESKKVFSSEEISSRFIIITAYSSAQVLERAKSYGCQLISKPFEDIKKAIQQLLGREENNG